MIRFKTVVLGCASVLLLCVGCQPSGGGLGASASISDKPEDAVKGFIAAVNAKDDKAAQSFVFMNGATVIPDVLKQFPITFEASDYKATMTEPYLADVAFNLKTSSEGSAPGMNGEGPDHVSLVAVGGKWKILPAMLAAPGSTSRMSLSSFVALMGMSQVFGQAKKAAEATSSLSNAKQLAMATLMYCGDSDEVFPLATNTVDGIMPYMKNRDLLTSPGDPKGSISYSFNDAVLGKSMTGVVYPATTVLLYEGKDRKLNFAHDGKAAVAFCDGHAKLYTEEEAKTLNWDPAKQ
jgi:prepilin-type processing-associated H-X9-DG protein